MSGEQEGDQQIMIDPITGQPIMHEYSVSQGWLPIDLGTVQGNLNYGQDLLSTGMDPAAGVLNGIYDPAAYQDIPVEVPEPELTLWPLYEQSNDPTSRVVFGRVQEGARPDQIVSELVELGYIEPDGDTAKGIMADASSLREEFSQVQRYQQALQNPQYETNPNAERFLAAGLPHPGEVFTDAEINPLLATALGNAAQGEKDIQAYKDFAGSDRFRGALESQAAATAGHENPEFDAAQREARQSGGSRDGHSRIERAGMTAAEGVQGFLGDRREEGLGGAAERYGKTVAAFSPVLSGGQAAARGLSNAWGWLNEDPDAEGAPAPEVEDDPNMSDGVAKLIATLATKNEERGGAATGVGGQFWEALNRVSQKHGAPRGSQMTPQDYEKKRQQEASLARAASKGGRATVQALAAQYDTNQARQRVGTPLQAALMGRMGL